MKVALVHDFLVQAGGAERVLKRLSEFFPDAPIFVWFYDKESVDPYFQTKVIHTSFIQHLPFATRLYQWYLPLLPTATDSFDLSAYDLVISSSSSFIKGVITLPKTLHLCYCHTPPRYLWTDTHDYVRRLRKANLIKKLLPLCLTQLRLYDVLSASRVDAFAANSHHVARRIWSYYRRESTVIYPPVDTKHIQISDKIGNYFLAGGRLMSYKRFDLIIRAFNKLGLPLIVYGTGREEKLLRSLSRKNIEFTGKISDTERNQLLSKALAFINPQEEDFGITPVESMAAGRPVIAYSAGGNLETVIPGKTGVLFAEQNAESLAEAVIRFTPEAYDPHAIRAHADRFSLANFQKNIQTFVAEEYEKYQDKLQTL